MNLKNQRPIFVPPEHQPTLEKLSKAALMDLVWDMAALLAKADEPIMTVIDRHSDIVLHYRQLDQENGRMK